MKHMKRLSIISTVLFAFLIAILVTACLPDPLEVNGIPKVKPQIVVSTQIIPDQSLVVLLTKSFGALDASEDSDPIEVLNQIAVNDAFVTITGPDKVDTLTFLGNGIYGGIQLDLVPSIEYKLDVESATLGKVSSTTTVLPKVDFEEIEAQLYFDGFDDTLAEVSFVMKDLAEKNWYLLSVAEVEEEDLEENLLNPGTFSRLLDDEEMNGTYGEVFRVFPREFERGDTIAVSLSNISQEYYNFLKMRQDNRFSLVEFLGEPVNYPSNVEGGKGFFNLYTPDIEFIVLE
jgi:hypothetical protein